MSIQVFLEAYAIYIIIYYTCSALCPLQNEVSET